MKPFWSRLKPFLFLILPSLDRSILVFVSALVLTRHLGAPGVSRPPTLEEALKRLRTIAGTLTSAGVLTHESGFSQVSIKAVGLD